MSGGHFDYRQYNMEIIADEIEGIVRNNHKKDEWGYSYDFSEETIDEFKKGVKLLRKAYVYAQRIDWLVSADDGEDSFHERLKAELEKLDD